MVSIFQRPVIAIHLEPRGHPQITIWGLNAKLQFRLFPLAIKVLFLCDHILSTNRACYLNMSWEAGKRISLWPFLYNRTWTGALHQFIVSPPQLIKHVLCKDMAGRCFLVFLVQCPFAAVTHNGVQPDSGNVGANSIISLVLVELILDLQQCTYK